MPLLLRPLAWLLLSLLLLAGGSRAATVALDAEERAWLAAHPTVRAAMHRVDIAPLQIWRDDGSVDGIISEYFALIQERTGLRIQPLKAPTLAARDADFRARRAELLPLVLGADPIAAEAALTPAFFHAPAVFVTRRDLAAFSPAGSDLGGSRIALMPGGAFEQWLRRRYPAAKYVLVDSPAAELAAVASGAADVRVGQLPTTVYTIESQLLANLSVRAFADGAPSTYSMGVPPEHKVLHRILRKALASITDEEHAAIQKKWVPVRHFLGLDARGLLLNDAERAWLRAHPRLRVAYDRSFAPFTMEHDGRMQGLGADLVHELARRLGLEISEARAGTWAETYAAGLAGTVDLVVAAARNEERRRHFDFVGPWVASPTAIVTRSDAGGPFELGDLRDRPLAIQESHFLLPLLARRHPALKPMTVPTLEDALAAVREGRAVAAVGNLNVLSSLIQRDHPGALTISGTVPDGDSELYFAVPRTQPELAVILAKGLQSLSEAELSALRQRWLVVQYRPGWRWQQVAQVFGPALLAALLAALWVQRHNRRLQAEVRQRHAAEQRLAESLAREAAASRSKSDFIASLAHEIRNPLGAMLAGIGLLTRRLGEERDLRLLGSMQRAGDGLLELLSRTLDFSKAEGGMLASRPEWVDVPDWAQDIVHAFEAAAAGKGLALTLDVQAPPGRQAFFDPVRIGQVLGNLLSNAVKFSAAGTVRVQVHGLDDALHVAVADSGPGIAAEDRERLFQPYTQLGGGAAPHPGGTGLGLALCRQIVERAGGRIALASTPGEGSEFRFELPVRWRQRLQAAAPPAHEMPADWRSFPVLAVDDDTVSLAVLAEQLRALDVQVETADDAEAALARWHAAPHRVLVTDCHMAGMDGFELTRRVRQLPFEPGRRPWIVAMTGSSDGDVHALARACGVDAVLVKPVHLDAWRSVLR